MRSLRQHPSFLQLRVTVSLVRILLRPTTAVATYSYVPTPPRKTVAASFPPHLWHVPPRGTRRGFDPHFVHLTRWEVKVRRLPTRSLRICVDRTLTATSSPLTATI